MIFLLQHGYGNGLHRTEVDEKAERIMKRASSGRSDQRQLQIIFHKAHQLVLRKYVPYAGIEELASGIYDCLTATAFLAGIVHEAGYEFDIMETNYHIFLLVRTSKGDVLLETTDPLNGFITGDRSIRERIKQYRTSKPPVIASQTALSFDFQLLREVSAGQLAGLLRFNQAVKAYNNKAWYECSSKLEMARKEYNSPRIDALALILMQTIIVTEIEEDVKESIRNRSIDVTDGLPVASR
jgi:hypothetical protein